MKTHNKPSHHRHPYFCLLFWLLSEALVESFSPRFSMPRPTTQIGISQTLNPPITTTETPKNYLVHRARSQGMIERSPAIAGMALCRGWTKEATVAFQQAVRKLGTFLCFLHDVTFESFNGIPLSSKNYFQCKPILS